MDAEIGDKAGDKAGEAGEAWAVRIAHRSGDEPPTSVRIPEQRLSERRQHVAIDALDAVAPQVIRVANGARVAELHLLIADAVTALEHHEPELALHLLREARADRMRTRGRSGGRRALDLGTS